MTQILKNLTNFPWKSDYNWHAQYNPKLTTKTKIVVRYYIKFWFFKAPAKTFYKDNVSQSLKSFNNFKLAYVSQSNVHFFNLYKLNDLFTDYNTNKNRPPSDFRLSNPQLIFNFQSSSSISSQTTEPEIKTFNHFEMKKNGIGILKAF